MRCEAERCGSLEDKLTLERYNICILSAYCLESESANENGVGDGVYMQIE